VTPDDLRDRITALLTPGGRFSAAEIARVIGSDRSSVNSILYANRDDLFERRGSDPPKWRLRTFQQATGQSLSNRQPPRSLAGDIHVDFAGGDWQLKVVIRDASRNDPLVEVERGGTRNRVIVVSNHVVPQEASPQELTSSATAVAASALAWEIACERLGVDADSFDWGHALTQIYLSLAAQVQAASSR
jgi:hypothetical protein